MKGLSIVLAAAGGAVAGAAIALLFAPDKGSETRKQIKQLVKDYCPGCMCDAAEAPKVEEKQVK